jgi:hypothetical protein
MDRKFVPIYSKQILCEQYQRNKDRTVDYFMNIKGKVKIEEVLLGI